MTPEFTDISSQITRILEKMQQAEIPAIEQLKDKKRKEKKKTNSERAANIDTEIDGAKTGIIAPVRKFMERKNYQTINRFSLPFMLDAAAD